MKKILLLLFAIITTNSFSQNIDDKINNKSDKKKFFNGYDGGMMLHAGYVKTNVTPLDYKAEGITKGIGGAIRFHIGNHYRIGTEGYGVVNVEKQAFSRENLLRREPVFADLTPKRAVFNGNV